MRLATLQTPQGPRAVLRYQDYYFDINDAEPTLPNSVREWIAGGSELYRKIIEVAKRQGTPMSPVKDASYHAPILDPQKIICIGLNYSDHAKEQNLQPPKEPVVFSKFVTTLIGHGQNIELPSVSNKVDYEAELVVVIGKGGRMISEADGMDHVAGYMVGHDVSARDWQKEKDGKQWLCGKSFDTFAPTGPEFITADEVKDPHQLPIRLKLNGEVMQESNTNQLIFSIPKLIAYISQVFTLTPGDLIFTGTPPGVGDARKPPVYMKPGDVAEVEIEGLGQLRNPVVQGR
ncbi:MAG: fumarylacetoacetate hydrolase family protein [Planctomycetia bacterium]|nr:fumarylacetoacetate hydrolase family protein [Planctomycetia bacterium]